MDVINKTHQLTMSRGVKPQRRAVTSSASTVQPAPALFEFLSLNGSLLLFIHADASQRFLCLRNKLKHQMMRFYLPKLILDLLEELLFDPDSV